MQKQLEYEAAQKAAKDAKAVKQKREDLAELMTNVVMDKAKKTEGEQVEALEKEAEKAKGPGPWGSKNSNPVKDIQNMMRQYKLTADITPNKLIAPGGVTLTLDSTWAQPQLDAYLADKVFPKVPVTPERKVVYTRQQAEWIEYEIKGELNAVERANPIPSMSGHLAKAKEGLIARVAGKNMVTQGDVQFAFEMDEEGDMWVTARVQAVSV